MSERTIEQMYNEISKAAEKSIRIAEERDQPDVILLDTIKYSEYCRRVLRQRLIDRAVATLCVAAFVIAVGWAIWLRCEVA